jgi:D-glucuronyl C5-epimerase C-terminus
VKLTPIVLFAVLALTLTAAAPGQRAARHAHARAKPLLPAQRIALQGIDRAAARGWIDHRSAAADRATVNRAARLIRHLPFSRSRVVADSLSQAAALAHRLNAPRALIVFGQLAVTSSHLARANPPPSHTDVTDADGVLYRFFSGRGFEFHPLGNFAALNTDLGAGRTAAAKRLAEALADRGVPLPGGGMGWEYCFDYGGGRAPWLSGMAQAAAAQGFAGAALLPGADSRRLNAAARGAYRSIPGRLAMRLAEGPWVRLYGFNSDIVLNAQLQSALSIARYARSTGDKGAADYAAALRRSAAALLPRFDTGYWTYYQLPRTPSPLEYSTFVVDLLHQLSSTDPRFADAYQRFAAYLVQPPAFRLADPSLGHVRFWLSKPAGVTVRSSAGATQDFQLEGGWYDVGWKLPSRAGAFPVQIVARDWAGNRAAIDALPIIRVGSSRAQAARAPAAVSSGQPAFAAGAALTDPTQAKLARARGFNTIQLALAWPAGATVPDPTAVAALNAMHFPGRVVLELVADPLPTDDAGRTGLAAYAASLVQQVPAVRDVLLGPPPAAADAAEYVDALALLAGSLTTVAVGAELDGAAKPAATLAAMGKAYSTAALATPMMSELAFRPAAKASAGAWTLGAYPKLLAGLDSAFAGTAQPGSTLPIVAEGVAQGTRIPSSKAGLYDPSTALGGATESEQTSVYTHALQTASCLPTVAGVVLGRLVDGPATGEQTGLYYADGTTKTSALAVGKAAARAVRGVLQICPGLAVPALPSTLVFPNQLTRGTPPSIRLGCVRDCLYLVTLEHVGDNRPVLAARGALRGGGSPATITLPAASFPAGAYRIAVRLITQTNPGRINLLTSPVLSG